MQAGTIDISKNLPTHIAIIMDGNGRWAKEHGLSRMLGHRHGVDTIHKITEAATRLGIKYLTLYAFSIENWNRPAEEVNALMSLLVDTLNKETPTLLKNNIRLNSIGDMSRLSSDVRKKFEDCIQMTAGDTGLELIVAVSYSARWDITAACKKVASEVLKGTVRLADIDETLLVERLSTASIPNPDLLIRTSGELRLSNFLLWELAYSELYFSDKMWPDFTEDDFYEAILDYQKRERRFGKTSEQVQ